MKRELWKRRIFERFSKWIYWKNYCEKYRRREDKGNVKENIEKWEEKRNDEKWME